MKVQTAEASALVDDFEAFYRRWFGSVARAMALVVQDVGMGEEIAQDGFRRTWERWSRLASSEHARNFVFEVSLNEARSILRRRRRFRLLGIERTHKTALPDPATGSTDRIAVFRALAELTERERIAVVLVDYLGYDSIAAGDVMKSKPSTVRVHLANGRRKARDLLGDDDA